MKQYRVQAAKNFKLASHNPDDLSGFKGDKAAAKIELTRLIKRLEALQELLYAQGKHQVLIVFQAMDAGGKDGTIRAVFDRVNPTGVKVASFKVPTEEERAHDFLWRIHKHTPGKGEMVIFNRSHYEDVLVVRVKKFVAQAVWKQRYEHIRNFEKLLAGEGTLILKFFLHISKEEQKIRLQERLDDPQKRWKFRKGDLEDRALWGQYMAAFEDALRETSTEYAPWYVIPANKNWYRNLMVAQTIVEALEGLKMKYPQPEQGLEGITIE
jgi:PPK2 family polyphosphate:nucleotide phosphotransferase